MRNNNLPMIVIKSHVSDVVSSSGEVEVQLAVPDTLTTWVASAFAVSNSTGLGVGELKPQVSVVCVTQ